MIGAIDEAKKKAPPDKADAKPKPGSKPEAKVDPKPAVDSKAKTNVEPQPKPKQKVEHAAGTHES